MRVLFLCNKSPWPPKEGGPMAMNMLIEGLAVAGHQVKVLAVNSFKYNISPGLIPETYRQTTEIELIDVDLRLKPTDALVKLLTGKSYHVSRFISKDFSASVVKALQEHTYDVVQLETIFMCPYIPVIRTHSSAKIVLRAHNIEHLIWERIALETANPLKKWYLNQLARALKRFEIDAVQHVDGILAITPTDAGLIKTWKNHRPVIDIPFGIIPERYTGEAGQIEIPSLFSLGSMNWIPNQEGIRWFLTHVWPDIHRQFPDLKYYLAGREMPAWMVELQLPNVVVVGEVPDARSFIASKSVMIVPLFSGSGIRVKIIEGMAAGKTVISTSIGAEGINYTHRENILIADTPCDFFSMVSICVSDPSVCIKIGEQAQNLVKTVYHTKILIEKMVAFYQQLPG